MDKQCTYHSKQLIKLRSFIHVSSVSSLQALMLLSMIDIGLPYFYYIHTNIINRIKRIYSTIIQSIINSPIIILNNLYFTGFYFILATPKKAPWAAKFLRFSTINSAVGGEIFIFPHPPRVGIMAKKANELDFWRNTHLRQSGFRECVYIRFSKKRMCRRKSRM